MPDTPAKPSLPAGLTLAFIGGGNMASAILGGLLRQGLPAAAVQVVEPFEEARAKLRRQFGVEALAIYEQLGDLSGEARVANNLGQAAYYSGRWDDALTFTGRAEVARLRTGPQTPQIEGTHKGAVIGAFLGTK